MRIDVGRGIELEVDRRGEGPPVVLIMGLGAQLIMWRDGLCDRLAGHGLEVIRFDNRDVGRSTWLDDLPVPPVRRVAARALAGLPVQVPYTLWDMADDVVGLLDALELERAHIVGASMGGMIGQCLAIAHPGRVASLTSMMSTTGSRRLSLGRSRALAVLFGSRPRDLEEYEDHTVRLFRTVGSTGAPFREEERRALAREQWERGLNSGGFARQLAAVLASSDRKERLREIRTPTLVVHGTADTLVPPAAGAATARAIPGARLRWVSGMGHDLPEDLWSELAETLAGHVHAAPA